MRPRLLWTCLPRSVAAPAALAPSADPSASQTSADTPPSPLPKLLDSDTLARERLVEWLGSGHSQLDASGRTLLPLSPTPLKYIGPRRYVSEESFWFWARTARSPWPHPDHSGSAWLCP